MIPDWCDTTKIDFFLRWESIFFYFFLEKLFYQPF
nr:MAG TPA: hypothetical protein [Caudoviricetes sp.]